MRIIFACTFLFSSLFSFSQDKVILIAGTVVEGKVTEVSGDTVIVNVKNKEGVKPLRLEAGRVFSIQYASGKEHIIYKQDSTIGNERSEEEMRSFIFGEQDAWAGHKPSHITVLGLILSGSGSYILTMDGNFLVIVVPVISYLILSAVLRPGLNKKAVRDPKYLSDDSYLDGYHRIAKSKKNKNALWGSVAGFWAGGLIAMQQKDWKFE